MNKVKIMTAILAAAIMSFAACGSESLIDSGTNGGTDPVQTEVDFGDDAVTGEDDAEAEDDAAGG